MMDESKVPEVSHPELPYSGGFWPWHDGGSQPHKPGAAAWPVGAVGDQAAPAASSPPSLSSRFAVERRRRFNINDRIKELGMLIPKANDLYVSVVSVGLG